MNSSELLRNRKRAMPQRISPPQGVPSSLRIQTLRYASAANISASSVNGGQTQPQHNSGMILSSDSILATKGHAAVCCPTLITEVTTIGPFCCSQVTRATNPPTQFPRGFYGPGRCKRPCPPVNNPPVSPWVIPDCPSGC